MVGRPRFNHLLESPPAWQEDDDEICEEFAELSGGLGNLVLESQDEEFRDEESEGGACDEDPYSSTDAAEPCQHT